ncbi:MAG: Co2+/Mg2+ efflux protein ApaG [Crocinitomicaceae bacterium]|jgi:ApaG protein|nr:Co2+/Mg2+ efflux protein ApaG [Crocinitomicaceae bacterium]
MNTKVTEGIRITVNAKYNEKLSYLEENSFVFEYHINIQNSNPDKVQLLSREWHVFDSLDDPHVVEGLGVVGEQPALNYNESHSYTSYCELKSEMGYMEGNYTFINTLNNKKFKVTIPRFYLVYPGKLN